MKKNLSLLIAAVTAVSLLAGCGSSKGMMNTADTAAQEAPAMTTEQAYDDAWLYDAGYGAVENESAAMPAEMPEEELAFEEGGAEAKAQEVPENPQAGRKLITTMNLSAETEHFDELMGNLEKQITAFGGYIESSNQWNGSVDYYGNRINDRSASLTVRIPAEKLDGFLTMMEESSNITNKSKNVEDVTLAYVDLESHKKALLTEEERLLELLEKAETVEDLISIEDKLANVRYQLESMESQLRTYDNKINYSTVYLDIQEVTRLTPPEEPTTWGRIKNGFSENVYNMAMDVQDFLIGLIINIPYILLWLVILAVVLLIVFLLAKHEKKKKAKRGLFKKVPAGQAPVVPNVVTPEQMEEMMDDRIIMSEEEQRNMHRKSEEKVLEETELASGKAVSGSRQEREVEEGKEEPSSETK